MNSRKHEARVAGVFYLLMAIAAVVSLNYVPSWSMFGGNAAAIANKIASSPLRYRIGIVSDLAAQVFFVFLVLALYQLLKEVNKKHAALMVALVFVQVPMAFGNMLLGIAPLVFLSGADYLSAFDKTQLDALALASLNVRGYGIKAIMTFGGYASCRLGFWYFDPVLFPGFLACS